MNVTRVMAKAAGSGTRPTGRRRAAKAQPEPKGASMGIPDLMSPGEVADLFGEDPTAVTTWAACGKADRHPDCRWAPSLQVGRGPGLARVRGPVPGRNPQTPR